jgi:hypothetical protein
LKEKNGKNVEGRQKKERESEGLLLTASKVVSYHPDGKPLIGSALRNAVSRKRVL